MTNDDILKVARECGFTISELDAYGSPTDLITFAHRIAAMQRDRDIAVIEAYQIPVGNSRSGELACEWTYAALKEIRDEIREQPLEKEKI